MIKILHSIMLFVCIIQFSSIYAVVNPKDIIKKGTKLVYDVNYYGSLYEFTVTVNDITNDNRFDWKMSAPINKNGTLTISKNAVENATGIFNYFSNEKIDLDDQTCIRLSNKMFDVFKGVGSMEIYTDKTNNILTVFGNPYNHTQTFGYKYNHSKEFNCTTVTDGNNYEITFVDEAYFPLIIEMKLDWTISLKNIIN